MQIILISTRIRYIARPHMADDICLWIRYLATTSPAVAPADIRPLLELITKYYPLERFPQKALAPLGELR